MSDDKPSRRHTDYTRTTPSIEESGECDSSDSWREGKTPPARPIPRVEVDASAFEADVRWAEFAEMRDEIRRCKADRLAQIKRRRWILGAVLPSGGAVLGLLIWAVSQLDARADAGAQERLRIQAIQRHDVEIRTLQDWRIRAETLLGLRVGNNP